MCISIGNQNRCWISHGGYAQAQLDVLEQTRSMWMTARGICGDWARVRRGSGGGVAAGAMEEAFTEMNKFTSDHSSCLYALLTWLAFVDLAMYVGDEIIFHNLYRTHTRAGLTRGTCVHGLTTDIKIEVYALPQDDLDDTCPQILHRHIFLQFIATIGTS